MKKRVLIVDDDETSLKLYVKYFASKDYEAIPAPNGKAAIEALRAHIPDLIVLDLAMPEMSGEQVLDEIHKHEEWRHIPIIIDTAVSVASGRMEEVERKYKDRHRIAFFRRPTSLELLEKTIGEILAL